MTVWTLGVGASHNGGACLLRDGELVVAVQEERLKREKRARLFPAFDTLSIAYCLDHEGIGVEDLALIAVSADEPVARPDFDVTRNPLLRSGPLPEIAYVAHHRAHAAAASYQSGFEDAAVLVIDGQGSPFEDLPAQERAPASRAGWETMTIYELSGGRLTRCLHKDTAPHRTWLSWAERGMPRFAGIGGMYSAVSQQLFGAYLEAGKVMGLAPHGRASIPVSSFLAVDDDRISFSDEVSRRFPFDDRWPSRQEEYANLAASVQAALEEAVLWAAHRARALTGARRLVFAGGVALNCIANERVIREVGFDDVFVMPAAEDSGISIGAVVEASSARGLPLAPRALARDSSGRPYGREEIEAAIAGCPVVAGEPSEAGPAAVAAALADGARVAWFAGGSELGPRALGQRSILADPRDPAAKDDLNRRKGRESFRPLAPIVLAEHAEEWLEMGGRPASPFMIRVCAVREERRSLIPAVVHVDGTARPQTVNAAQHPALHETLSRFYAATGVPVLVNTSLNAAGEPIVETPEDTLWCAHRLGLDLAVLEGTAVRIADRLDEQTVVSASRHRIRRLLGSDGDAAEVEVQTPWGATRYALAGDELATLRALAAGPATIEELERNSGTAALEALRRKRLVRLSTPVGEGVASLGGARREVA
jgi:carbamoyltransferase